MKTADPKKPIEPEVGPVFEYERQLWQARFSPCGRFVLGAGYNAVVPRWKVIDPPSADDATAGESEQRGAAPDASGCPSKNGAAAQSASATKTSESGKSPSGADAAPRETRFEPLSPLTGHHGWVQCLAFLPAGERVVTADSWGRISCWKYSDDDDGAPLWSHEHGLAGWIRSIAVSPDGTLVAAAGNDQVIRVFRTEDGSIAHTIDGVPDAVFSLIWLPNGNRVLAGDRKAVLREWSLPAGQVQHEMTIEGLYQLNALQDCGGIRHLALSSDGRQILVGGMKDPSGGFAKGAPVLVLLDWPSGEHRQELAAGDTQDGFIYDAWFHPEGFIVGTSCAFPGKGRLFFWKPGDDKPFFQGKSLTNGRSVSLHPDGKRLLFTASNSSNGNGRPLKDGQYIGGSARLTLLRLPEPVST